jgi:hypothetical protein
MNLALFLPHSNEMPVVILGKHRQEEHAHFWLYPTPFCFRALLIEGQKFNESKAQANQPGLLLL